MSKINKKTDSPLENPELSEVTPELSQPDIEAPSQTPEPLPEKTIQKSAEIPAKPQSNLGKTIWKVIIFIIKLMILLVILFALGVAAYLAWPQIYKRYILPVEVNTSNISVLNTQQADVETHFSGLETQVAAMQTGQPEFSKSVVVLGDRLDTLETQVMQHSQALTLIDEMGKTLTTNNAESNERLNQQIKLMKSMELLSRARLFLYQSNFGLAKQDIQIARDMIATTLNTNNLDGLVEVVQRLDLCLARLPDYPVAASDDLDIAWQILLQGTPQPGSLPTTPIPTATEFFTVTPDPLLMGTPTPTAFIDMFPTETPTFVVTPTFAATPTP